MKSIRDVSEREAIFLVTCLHLYAKQETNGIDFSKDEAFERRD